MNTRIIHTSRSLYKGFGVIAILTSLVVAALLVGCSPVQTTPPTSKPAAVVATPAPTPIDLPNNILNFGEVFTWDDEISLSVSEPTVFVPSEYSYGLVDGQTAVVFTFVVTNGSDNVVDPMTFVSLASGGFPSASIMDADSPVGDLLLYPSASLLPGKSVQWMQAYSVADLEDMTLEVSPGARNAVSVIFTNSY